MRKIISIIIPVYNAEKYLSRCIGSILRQSFADFELILVDDGSKDRSGVLCDKYALKDARIKVLHKENGGVSSARNLGLENAQGKYITFIDADDWVAENYLEKLLDAIENTEAQFVVGKLENREVTCREFFVEDEVLDFANLQGEEIHALFTRDIFCGPWVKLFVSRIIQQHNLRFKEGMRFGEDTLFVRDYLLKCERICTIKDKLYFYNKLNDGSATKSFDPNIRKWVLLLTENYYSFLSKFNIDEEQRKRAVAEYAFERFCGSSIQYIQKFSRENAIVEIEKNFLNLSEYLLMNVEWESAENGYTVMRKAVIEGNFPRVYQEYNRILNGRKFRRWLAGVRFIILSPWLERTRDGLNKYRYLDK